MAPGKIYQSREDYNRQHVRCPKCRKEPSFETYVGFLFQAGQPYRDTNTVKCACGWVGSVDDLEPLKI